MAQNGGKCSVVFISKITPPYTPQDKPQDNENTIDFLIVSVHNSKQSMLLMLRCGRLYLCLVLLVIGLHKDRLVARYDHHPLRPVLRVPVPPHSSSISLLEETTCNNYLTSNHYTSTVRSRMCTPRLRRHTEYPDTYI